MKSVFFVFSFFMASVGMASGSSLKVIEGQWLGSQNYGILCDNDRAYLVGDYKHFNFLGSFKDSVEIELATAQNGADLLYINIPLVGGHRYGPLLWKERVGPYLIEGKEVFRAIDDYKVIDNNNRVKVGKYENQRLSIEELEFRSGSFVKFFDADFHFQTDRDPAILSFNVSYATDFAGFVLGKKPHPHRCIVRQRTQPDFIR